ncbi:progonadoliberin-2 [Phascolarctos cinereus]|uniref:Progonadoliberin n=2 Tax=Phascolarctos cinereus TaxID=38626 RepID=A0A6P5LRJ1_PHACI|nr:progonadoliberin-2 [Phascolarctos cinereus]
MHNLSAMSCLRPLLLLGLLVLWTQISYAQHWSHGWYPGGKRALDEIPGLEASEEGKLWDGGERSLLKTLLADVLAQQQQK